MQFRHVCIFLAILLGGCVLPDSPNDIELVAPQILSPVAGDTLVSLDARFRWKSVAAASAYRVQLSEGAQHESLVVDTIVEDTSIVLPRLKNNTMYYLRVAGSRTSEAGPWSEQSFRVAPPLPMAVPQVLNPLPHDTLVRPDVQFRWKSVAAASTYRVQLADDPQFVNLKVDTIVNDTFIVLQGLKSMSVHFWRVAGSRTSETGPWTARGFRVFAGFQSFNAFKPGDIWVYGIDNSRSTWGVLTSGEVTIALADLKHLGDSVVYALSFRDSTCTAQDNPIDFQRITTCGITLSADTVIFRASTGAVLRTPQRITPLCTQQDKQGVRIYALQEGQDVLAVAALGSTLWESSTHFVETYGLIRDVYIANTMTMHINNKFVLRKFNGIVVSTTDWVKSFP